MRKRIRHEIKACCHSMIRRSLLICCTLLLNVLNPSSLTKADPSEHWVDCLYNNKSIACRQTFLCPGAPCNSFRIDWIDGISDTYTRTRDGSARNVGFYQDARGGDWMLRGFAGSFALVNQTNQNTIIVGMTLKECRQSFGLSDLCSR